MLDLFSDRKESLMSSFNKYRENYGRTSTVVPLKHHKLCMLLHPKILIEHDKMETWIADG